MVTVADQRLGRRPQRPGMIDDQRCRQQQQPAEQQRARRHHHRVVVGSAAAPKIVAQANEMVASRITISAKILAAEAAERIEADDHGRSGKPEDGAGKLQQRGRFVPRDAPGDEEGEDRRRRGQHHGVGRRHILLRPGDHQERNRRIDGLLLGEQLPGLGVGRHRACRAARRTASRKAPRSASAPR